MYMLGVQTNTFFREIALSLDCSRFKTKRNRNDGNCDVFDFSKGPFTMENRSVRLTKDRSKRRVLSEGSSRLNVERTPFSYTTASLRACTVLTSKGFVTFDYENQYSFIC